MKRFKGLIAATFTPMHADRSIHFDAIGPMVERLVVSGVNGLYVNGSTGEGPSLRSAERRQTLECFVSAVRGRIPVIVQVGHDSVAEAVALTAHAVSVGVDAISAVPPSYYPIDAMETLTGTMAPIAEASGDLPFYYYHIPRFSGVAMSMVAWLEQAAQCMPNLAGVKFTAADTETFGQCVQAMGDRFDLLWGVDEMLLQGWHAGARGAVGSTYNFAMPLYRKLLEALEAGDGAVAQAIQARACRMVDVIAAHGGLGVQKAMMGLSGTACGPSRWPIRTLGEAEVQEVRSKLETIGFFENVTQGAEA